MKHFKVGGNIVKGKQLQPVKEFESHEGSVMHCAINKDQSIVASTD